MNCKEREKQILLAQSGELPEKTARELEKHITECEQCRTYRDSLDDILAVSGNALRSGVPSDPALHRIKVAALNREDSKQTVLFRPAVPALAAAAALVIAVGIWKMVPTDEAARTTDDLDAILMMVRYDEYDETAYTVNDEQKTVSELADELLSMEGFSVDELLDDEWFTSDEEHPATGLLLRSTPDSQAKICV